MSDFKSGFTTGFAIGCLITVVGFLLVMRLGWFPTFLGIVI